MERLVVQDPIVLVLAVGRTASDVNNNKGHLLESFVARLLALLGYGTPRTENLNVLSEGIELDVRAAHVVTNQALIAECKAYKGNVPAHMLSKFYGDLTANRMDEGALFGLFVALPRLAAPGVERANKIMGGDKLFKYMSGFDLAQLLISKNLLCAPPDNSRIYSDFAVLITQEGLYSAAKELDPLSRLPMRVRVWKVGPESVPTQVVSLLQADPYSDSLPVQPERGLSLASLRQETPEIDVSLVQGAGSDFEYQLPAAPSLFVGRDGLLSAVESIFAIGEPASIVLNAQSGWGKSSLALKLAEMASLRGGHALVVDTRTATEPAFVVAAMRRAIVEAAGRGLCTLPSDAAFSSVSSCLRTIRGAAWQGPPLLVFFDQFENAFRSRQLTAEFCSLALGIRETESPILLGYAWKTDLVGWTEGHPYELRDAIRIASKVFQVPTFGAKEIGTLLKRLEELVGTRLHPELQQRVREYSQGLPWLFKKLASHIHRELHAGASQDQLLSESLNVAGLFKSDLAELQPEEHEGLILVARQAPVAVSEVLEKVKPQVVQALLDRRLLVQVGERLDTYWDIFRDFLITGRVPDVKDSYILRQTPRSAGRLLRLLWSGSGTLSVQEAAEALDTTEAVVFNLSRDLRLLGVLKHEPTRVALSEQLVGAPDREAEVRKRVLDALRRHRIVDVLADLREVSHDALVDALSAALPTTFPAVAASQKTWTTYARAFVMWCQYAGISPESQPQTRHKGRTDRLLDPTDRQRAAQSFPQCAPGPCIALLRHLTGGSGTLPGNSRTRAQAARDLISLGAIEVGEGDVLRPSRPDLLDVNGAPAPVTVLELLVRVPGGAQAIDLLRSDPAAAPVSVGHTLARGHGVEWADSTALGVGKHFRAWARVAGVATARAAAAPASTPPSVRSPPPEEQGRLFFPPRPA